jgi:hypothetical protein
MMLHSDVIIASGNSRGIIAGRCQTVKFNLGSLLTAIISRYFQEGLLKVG